MIAATLETWLEATRSRTPPSPVAAACFGAGLAGAEPGPGNGRPGFLAGDRGDRRRFVARGQARPSGGANRAAVLGTSSSKARAISSPETATSAPTSEGGVVSGIVESTSSKPPSQSTTPPAPAANVPVVRESNVKSDTWGNRKDVDRQREGPRVRAGSSVLVVALESVRLEPARADEGDGVDPIAFVTVRRVRQQRPAREPLLELRLTRWCKLGERHARKDDDDDHRKRLQLAFQLPSRSSLEGAASANFTRPGRG